MSEWEVRYRFGLNGTVAADSYEAASLTARAQGQRIARASGFQLSDARLLKQLGEPWVRSGGWWDHHRTDVIICKRSMGNSFTAAEVRLLRGRLQLLGLKVEEHWNGEGSGTVSFRCSGREGTEPMSAEHIAKLVAPLPKAANRE